MDGPTWRFFFAVTNQAYFLTAEHKACISSPIRSGMKGENT